MTAALAAAARQRADQTRQRATEALQRLHATGQPITFAHVARTAGVSRSWLYRQPDLRAEIERLRRVATAQAVPVPTPERGSAESLRQRLEAALDEITRLKADNHQLRQHLAQHLGHRRQNRIPAELSPGLSGILCIGRDLRVRSWVLWAGKDHVDD